MSEATTSAAAASSSSSVGCTSLDRYLCAFVSNVPTQDKCIELLNGISYNYEIATYYERILVSGWVSKAVSVVVAVLVLLCLLFAI